LQSHRHGRGSHSTRQGGLPWRESGAAQPGFWSYSLIGKVVEAVLSHHPDWVIWVSKKQTEGLIEKTQSKYNPGAARWLLKAKMAYLASGRQSEWQACLSNLKITYARRPALQRELYGL